jgi:hypothetical protein
LRAARRGVISEIHDGEVRPAGALAFFFSRHREVDMKRCTRCGKLRPQSHFYRRSGDPGGGRLSTCKPCYSIQRRARVQDSRRLIREYAETCRARTSRVVRAANAFIRAPQRGEFLAKLTSYYRLQHEAIVAYGGYRCACCKETEPLFLTIDHVKNNGGRHRRRVGFGDKFYRWLKDRGYPPGFQVLCLNCNQGRWRNGGVCPHHAHGRHRKSGAAPTRHRANPPPWTPPRHSLFRETRQVLFRALSEAPRRPLTTRDLAFRCIAARNLDGTDKRLVALMTRRIGDCMRHYAMWGLVTGTRAGRTMLWTKSSPKPEPSRRPPVRSRS